MTRPSRKSAPSTCPGPSSPDIAIGYQHCGYPASPVTPRVSGAVRCRIPGPASPRRGVVVRVMGVLPPWPRPGPGPRTGISLPVTLRPVTAAVNLPTRPARALRADAARNLDAVLDAARRTFAERGTDVPVEEIARAAGVGVGTVYRRFPNKDAL